MVRVWGRTFSGCVTVEYEILLKYAKVVRNGDKNIVLYSVPKCVIKSLMDGTKV